jgi:Ca2+-binding RTX toxin-like protein
MTAHIQSTDQIGNTAAFSTTVAGDSYTVLAGVNAINTVGNAVTVSHDSTLIANFGTVLGAEHGVFIKGASNCEIVNRADATIGSISATSNWSTISIVGNNNTVVNQGVIDAVSGTGIYVFGGNWSVTNSGTVRGSGSGILAGGPSASYTIANSGTIEASGGTGSSAVTLNSGVLASVVNRGLIQNVSPSGGWGIVHYINAVIVNEAGGVIFSNGGAAIQAFGSVAVLDLRNDGLIAARPGISPTIQGSGQNDTIRNTGHIDGDVVLGNGQDVFDGIGGTVGGNVIGGTGNDTFRVSDPTAQVSEFSGEGTADVVVSTVDFSIVACGEMEGLTLVGTAVSGTGNGYANTLYGNFVGNLLVGGYGNDTVVANEGDDTVDGGGDDLIYAGDGNDSMQGRAGLDTIFGEEGDDVLHGGSGRDSLSGGDGEDTLTGGAGRDALNGGADADTFVFLRVSDSGTTTATRDTIQAFGTGEDTIDLSRIDANANTGGNQAFTFLGTGAFTNVAGQLRFDTVTGDLLADVNGNGVADFSVRLLGVAVLTAGDIIL